MSLEQQVDQDEQEFLAGLPPLVHAAATGDVELVRSLLSQGADVAETDEEGWSALHAAASRRHPEVVEVLLAAGADPQAATLDGFTVLLNAAGPGDARSVAALLNAGANVRAQSHRLGWTPLSRAADNGNLPVLELLLAAGADPHEDEPLVAAAEAGSLACVRALLAAGADPTVRTDGSTPAELALLHGHTDVANHLDGLADV
ncbi:ankyrin repeat domain-containing protein [Cellulomonas sp. NS3]|uniref:ankyrin repeat domain-containing protein n=1 Tax=Cellulomonas sp. NS3 TaxID=2973977 RepID=UPI0021626F26|nr:ankyrin repeat domain-containing protein [Cellulomonas sp. NS3]